MDGTKGIFVCFTIWQNIKVCLFGVMCPLLGLDRFMATGCLPKFPLLPGLFDWFNHKQSETILKIRATKTLKLSYVLKMEVKEKLLRQT